MGYRLSDRLAGTYSLVYMSLVVVRTRKQSKQRLLTFSFSSPSKVGGKCFAYLFGASRNGQLAEAGEGESSARLFLILKLKVSLEIFTLFSRMYHYAVRVNVHEYYLPPHVFLL